MKTPMLQYVKTILEKVSFSKNLFRKEYRKSFNWLSKSESQELKSWIRQQVKTVKH
jgi:hypothetical protein